MNLSGVAKHYSALNPRERFTLMEAAELRDDAAELRRLEASAAKLTFHIADYVPFSDSWRALEMAFLGDMMYECAALWQAMYLATRHDDEGDRLPDLLYALAYKVLIVFDGWARFCQGIQIPPPGNIQTYGNWSFIVDTVDLSRALAFTRDQMQGWLAEQHGVDYDQIEPRSVESKAAAYAEAYTMLLRQWGKTP